MKRIIVVIIVLLAAGGGYAWYIWNKPHRDVADETAIKVAATQLFADYEANEQQANSKYLNKAVEVTGEVAEVKKNQQGKTVAILKSSDPMFGVNCTFKTDPGSINKGDVITFKGVCTGLTADVVVNDGMIVKRN